MSAQPVPNAGQPAPTNPIRSEYATDPDMIDLVQLFASEMPARVALVRSCWEEKRLNDLKRVAHQLKGAGGGYGFASVGDAAGRLESGVKNALEGRQNTDLESLRKQVDELLDVLNRVTA